MSHQSSCIVSLIFKKKQEKNKKKTLESKIKVFYPGVFSFNLYHSSKDKEIQKKKKKKKKKKHKIIKLFEHTLFSEQLLEK